jgi:hypothetical protein
MRPLREESNQVINRQAPGSLYRSLVFTVVVVVGVAGLAKLAESRKYENKW